MIGPILYLDDISDRMHIAALFISDGEMPADIRVGDQSFSAVELRKYDEKVTWHIRFDVPLERTEYHWNGQDYPLNADLSGDMRMGFVSCNGEEVGDLEREGSERNAMWARLRDEHRENPFAVLLHGGDQIYADEVTKGHPLSEEWPDKIPRDPSRADIAELRHHLRERFVSWYSTLFSAPEFAWLAARVPSLTQWDDHDICDGWGSLPRSRTYSPVGQALFEIARESCLIFQHAAVDGDLPPRFLNSDGDHLGWVVRAKDLRILAPDLRSERTRREVMGEAGWADFDAEAQREESGHTFLVSSVPLLGPRLSLVEMCMILVPKMQEYEDDLRDQWQSRAHRDEWRRILRSVIEMAQRAGHDVTALSGEIHLATRAEMQLNDGLTLHQLVASGIAHRAPPRAWARFLGALSWLGEDPLPNHPIGVRRIPGQKHRYIAQRNYLVLDRIDGAWHAAWEFEDDGRSPALPL